MDKDTRLFLMYPTPADTWRIDWKEREKNLPPAVEHLRQLAVMHYTTEMSLEKLDYISKELTKCNYTETILKALEHIDEAIRILAPLPQLLEQEIDEKLVRPKRKQPGN